VHKDEAKEKLRLMMINLLKILHMKNMKGWLLVLCVWTAVASMAQNGPRQPMPVPDRVARTIERLKPELLLTEKQIKEIEPVYTEFFTESDKLRAGGERPSPEARQKLTDARDEKLKKILSEEQFKKLKELEEQMRQQRRPQ
jgi:periplasmic protein CpxP/Spy